MPPTKDRIHLVAQWNRHLSFFGLSALAPNGKNFTSSPIRLTFSVLVCILFIILFCFQIVYTNFINPELAVIVMRGYLVFGSNIVSFLIVVSALLHSKETAELLNMFVSQRCHVTMINNGKLIVAIFILLSLSLALDFMQFYFNPESRLMVLINTLSNHTSLLYILLHIYQFSVCLIWLKASIFNLKECLRSVDGDSFGGQQTLDNNNSEHFPQNKRRNKTLHDIREWRKQFYDLVLVNDKLNDVFAFRHLVTVGHNFLLGTLFAYGALTEIVSTSIPVNAEDTLELAVQLKWAILSFASIYALILPSRMTARESSASVEAVLFALSKPLPFEIRDELHNFALQFLHGDMIISPYGYFRLNHKLLLSIIGALLSYLVVLIQFRVSSFL